MVFHTHDEIAELYDRYADMLYRIALTHTCSCDDASDAVHDAFVKFVGCPRRFNDEEYAKAWFIRVVINKCHDIARKKSIRNHVPLDEVYSLAAEEDTLPENVKIMLEGIPEIYRTVVILHYLEDLSLEQIAKTLDISLSSVKMRLKRAREYIKEKHKKEEFYV